MKKNLIALGVTTALAVIAGQAAAGVIGGSTAIVSSNTAGGTTTTEPQATSLVKNAGGVGNVLLFPYYSAQGDNATLLNIVNTDTVNGKLVKVRFRGAGNSDDVFDFQVALSPGDVWAAAVSKNADGVASLNTADNSCTLPASVNLPFNTNRLDASSTKTVAEQTLEGYVEVINMADIPRFIAVTGAVGSTASALYTAIKHKSTGAVDCATTTAGAAAFELLKSDITDVSGAVAAGLTYPTSGLAGDWIILNQANTAAWSGSATALEARNGTAKASANLVFFPQTDEAYTAQLNSVSTDPVFQGNNASPSTAIVMPKMYDFPDLSTAYTVRSAGATDPAAFAQRLAVTNELAVGGLANEYVTDDSIAAVTDLLFSQPTRRYWAAVNYTATATDALAGSGAVARAVETVFSATTAAPTTPVPTAAPVARALTSTNPFYSTANSSVISRLLCLTNVSSGLTQFDRSERTSTSGFVVSPGTSTSLPICGEAAVVSINAGDATQASALNATLARNNIELSFVDGWVSIDVAAQNAGGALGTFYGTGTEAAGLPISGSSFMRASNGAVNYGFAFPHKITK